MLKKIELMYKLFGAVKNHKCVECSNLEAHQKSGTATKKCRVYGITNSEATDWKNKYQSCGQFNKTYTGVPIIEKKKHLPHDTDIEQPMPGQLDLFDG